MSEAHPIYIRCASDNNGFADCMVRRRGDLIQQIGHAQMDFAPENANSSGDAIVDETIQMLLARSKLGQEKYGTALMRNDLSLLDWMRHAIEESLDRTLYMIRALKDLEKLYDDGR